MPVLLQVDFPYSGPWGEDNIAQQQIMLAQSIAEEQGLIWKIWTENEQTGEAGGIYLFNDEASANAYLTMHQKRLESFGIKNIRAKLFNVNQTLSLIDKFPKSALTDQ